MKKCVIRNSGEGNNKIRIWYASTYWEYLYYHVFQLFRLKYWWQDIRIKCGHHYDWQDYQWLDISEI